MSTFDRENFPADFRPDDRVWELEYGEAHVLPSTPVRAGQVFAGLGGTLPDLRPVPVRHRRMPQKDSARGVILMTIALVSMAISGSVLATVALALLGGVG
jgi:hypothetical protein